MIRIKPRRCGYGGEKGYTCQRLPQLQDWMFNEEIPFIAQMKAEFNKLPLRVKGMVYTEETIDMGWSEFGPHPEVPELTCRSNTDPASDTTDVSVWGATGIPVEVGNATAYPVYGGSNGWLDLFNSGYEITGGTQYFYHNISGTAAATSDVYIKVTGVDHEYHDIYLVGNIPTFKNGEQEMEMGPGLLEPMLDTDFAPVGIDTIPAWEAGLDADIFTNIVLNAWKGVIDDRIRNIYWRLNNIQPGGDDTNLRNLKNSEYAQADCDNFNISLDSGGSALRTYAEVSSGGASINTYTVGSGHVYVEGREYTVEGISNCIAPFYAYLKIEPEYTSDFSGDVLPEGVTIGASYVSGGTVTEIIEPSQVGEFYRWTVQYPYMTGASCVISSAAGQPLPGKGIVGIGGVNVVVGGTGPTSYVLFKVFRDDCIVSAELGDDTGMVNHEYPNAEPPPDGPEWSAGPVYPYDNIRSGTTGTNRLEWGHSAYVPTVNATYEFVHNDTYSTGDSMADTQALAHKYVTSGGNTIIMSHRLTVDGIQFCTAEVDMASGPVDWISAATADLTDAEAAINAAEDELAHATTPEESATALVKLEDAETSSANARNDLEAANTYSEGLSPCSVTGGTPGTANLMTALIVSGGDVLTPPQADATAPTLQAMYDFVHGPFGMATYGSVYWSNGSALRVDHGIVGVVRTVDEINRNLYELGEDTGYYYDEVPTIRAVVKFVDENMSPGGALAIIGDMYVSAGGGAPYVFVSGATAGTVIVANNIAYYDYVSAGAYVSSVVRYTAVDTIPTAQAIVNYGIGDGVGNGIPSLISQATAYGDVEYVSSTKGLPGTVQVFDNILWESDSLATTSTLFAGEWGVPTLGAVDRYIHNVYAMATVGSAYVPDGGTDATYTGTIPGTYKVVSTIPLIPEDGTYASMNEVVPTVKAVMDYVDIASGGVALAFVNSAYPNAVTPGPEGSSGTVYLFNHIESGDSANPGTSDTWGSSAYAPTVNAVFDFVHTSETGATKRALGTVTCVDSNTTTHVVSIHSATGTADARGSGIPGTIRSIEHIYWDSAGTYPIVFGGHDYVPTASAVAEYVDSLVGGATVCDISQNTEWGAITTSTGSEGRSGTVLPYDDILVSSNTTDHTTSVGGQTNGVPSVQAVYKFVHSTYAKASAVDMTGTGTAPGYTAVTHTGTPGTYQVATNILLVSGTTQTATGCVPTAQAVVDYVEKNKGGAGFDYNGDFKVYYESTTAKWMVSSGTAYYPGGSAIYTGGSATPDSATGMLWIRVYRTANNSTVSAGITNTYSWSTYEQRVPLAKVSGTSVCQYQLGPVIVEGRWG